MNISVEDLVIARRIVRRADDPGPKTNNPFSPVVKSFEGQMKQAEQKAKEDGKDAPGLAFHYRSDKGIIEIEGPLAVSWGESFILRLYPDGKVWHRGGPTSLGDYLGFSKEKAEKKEKSPDQVAKAFRKYLSDWKKSLGQEETEEPAEGKVGIKRVHAFLMCIAKQIYKAETPAERVYQRLKIYPGFSISVSFGTLLGEIKVTSRNSSKGTVKGKATLKLHIDSDRPPTREPSFPVPQILEQVRKMILGVEGVKSVTFGKHEVTKSSVTVPFSVSVLPESEDKEAISPRVQVVPSQ